VETIDGLGLDPSGLEADGWLYAQLFISRPRIS
jgi:carnitine O-acetyltransferase